MQQLNPPYDRSAPCPGCQQDVRNISALIHNFLNRCDVPASRIREGKAMVKLFDMRRETIPSVLTVPHAATEELVAVARELVAATEGMTQDGLTIRWTPEITARVEALIQRAASASDAYRLISDAHFADHRHSRGEENILRESHGASFAGHVNPDYAAARYDYTVEPVAPGAGDLVHNVCGANFDLHEHFKDQLALDPTFYGKVWCPLCKINAPWHQFTLSPDVLLIAA